MPIHDYKCTYCGHESEEIVKWDEYKIPCMMCGGSAKREYKSFNGIKKEDPNWLGETLEVVNKDGGAHCQEFLKHPTRRNYDSWLKGEGLRPLERGESTKLKKRDTSSLRKRVTDKFKKDNVLTVR